MSTMADGAPEGPRYINAPDHCLKCDKESVNLKSCSRCFGAAYCCKECQLANWPNHKTRCTNIGVWNLLQAIEFDNLERVGKLARTTPKVVNGESKQLGPGDQYMVTRPLLACVCHDNIEAMRMLLESGNATQIDIRNSNGDTALHMAAGKPNNMEVMSLLLEHGADPNGTSADGFSVLMMAARDYDLANTRCVLDAGGTEHLHDVIQRINMMSGGKMLEGETIQEFMERKNQTLRLLQQYA